MKKKLHILKLLLPVLLCFGGLLPGQSQRLATLDAYQPLYPDDQDAQKRSLKAVLKELEIKYNISIGYVDEDIKDKFASMPDMETHDLDEILDSILKPVKLSYKKIDEFYLIKPIEAKPGELKKLDRTSPFEKIASGKYGQDTKKKSGIYLNPAGCYDYRNGNRPGKR